jgi:hypothetical protein
VAFGTHAAVGEDLGDGILGGRALLALVGGAERLDVVERVVVADVLECVGDALDEVFLLDVVISGLSRGWPRGPSPRQVFCSVPRGVRCFPSRMVWVMMRSTQAMASAETQKSAWIMTCHMIVCSLMFAR